MKKLFALAILLQVLAASHAAAKDRGQQANPHPTKTITFE